MLFPTWLGHVLLGASIALVVVGGLYVARSRRRWLRIIGPVLGVVGVVIFANAPRALVVRDGDSGPQVQTMRVFGTPGAPPPTGDCRPTRTWVVNRSSRSVRVEHVKYGDDIGLGGEAPQVIPPGTACSSHDIDYIGPTDRPPSRVLLQSDEARLRSGDRTWLTW